jgi:integrase
MNLTIDPLEILTLDEIRTVLADGERRGRRSVQSRQNTIVFRLATCCGLRASEIAGLELRDVHAESDAPHIAVRKALSKRARGRKDRKRYAEARRVPLWDRETAAALRSWLAERRAAGAADHAPVVCVLVDHVQASGVILSPTARSTPGRALTREQVAVKFKRALRPLPAERRAMLHTHSGRHSFGTWMARELPLEAVRDAMGHANIATTSVYLHVDPETPKKVTTVFASAPSPAPISPPPPLAS